jgi:hypothetical protein
MSIGQLSSGSKTAGRSCRELARYVPGYSGYRLKESRRREDKRLRGEVARMLHGGAARLEAVEKEAFLSGLSSAASSLARSRRRLDEISEFVRSVSPAHPRFFAIDVLSASKLAGLQEADLEIFRLADSIVKCISKLEQSDIPPDEREFRTNYLADFIDRLGLAYDGRQGLLAEGW